MPHNAKYDASFSSSVHLILNFFLILFYTNYFQLPRVSGQQASTVIVNQHLYAAEPSKYLFKNRLVFLADEIDYVCFGACTQ